MNPVQQIDAGLADRLREGEISRVDLIEQILDDEVERHGHEDMGIETLEIARRIDDALKSAAVSSLSQQTATSPVTGPGM